MSARPRTTHERTECPACAAPLAASRPWLERSGYHLLRCGACTHGFVRELPDAETLARTYSAAYFAEEVYCGYAEHPEVPQRTFRRLLDGLEPRQGTLVEVGCAYGFFLELATARYRCAGVELSAAARAACRERGLRVVAQVDELEDFRGQVDLAVLWDTIEHVSEPEETLRGLHRLLRPRGQLHLSTGDLGSGVARLRGASWRLIDPPQHLHYFTRASLRALAGRCGFEVCELGTLAQERSWAFMANLVGRRAGGLSGALLTRLARRLPPGLSSSLDLRDVMRARLVAL